MHPASTTHQATLRRTATVGGSHPDLSRSGLEAVEDIIWDLEQGLTKANGKAKGKGGRKSVGVNLRVDPLREWVATLRKRRDRKHRRTRMSAPLQAD
ncbi:MAG: hypothetical protein R2839_03430 [Thermomicrobiales bacterium]